MIQKLWEVKMKQIVHFLVVLLVLGSSSSFAAEIYLKDGTVVKGAILQRDQFQVILRIGKVPRKYYMDLIDRIVEDEELEAQEQALDIDFGQFENVSPAKVALIISFLEANGTRLSLEKNMQQIIASAPQREAELKDLLAIDGLVATLIPVYDRYYSEEDLKEAIAFYKSPAGQKVIEVTPEIMKESLRASAQYFQEKLTSQ